MRFSTRAVAPRTSHCLRFAVMPITVSTQVPSDVASKSVGEKLSPKPSWSLGASVCN